MEVGRTRAMRPIGSRALNIARIEAGFILPKVGLRVGRAYPVPRHRALAARAGSRRGWSTSTRATSPAGARCSRSSGAVRAACWSDSMSRATSRRTTRCCIPSAPGGAKPAASLPRPGRRPASAIWRWHWWMRRTAPPARTVWADIYLNRELVWERRMVRARVVERPFFAPATAPRHASGGLLSGAQLGARRDRDANETTRRPALARSERQRRRSSSTASARPTAPQPRSITSASASTRAKCSPWWEPRGAARPRCCGCSPVSRCRAAAASASTGWTWAAVPPHERPVNMMFQSYALFPHMTVEANVGYGLRRLPLSDGERRQRTQEALEMVQLGALGAAQAAPAVRRPAPARGAGARADPPAQGAAAR